MSKKRSLAQIEKTGSDNAMVRQIVDRMHVADSDEEVDKYVRSRMKKAHRDTPEADAFVKEAIAHHHHNRDQYRRIMSGRLNSNPRQKLRRQCADCGHDISMHAYGPEGRSLAHCTATLSPGRKCACKVFRRAAKGERIKKAWKKNPTKNPPKRHENAFYIVDTRTGKVVDGPFSSAEADDYHELRSARESDGERWHKSHQVIGERYLTDLAFDAKKNSKKRKKAAKKNPDIKLYANPYDTSKRGWYFDSAEDFEAKYKKHLPTEEYEIEFIDGTQAEAQLFEQMGVHQGSVEGYFDIMDKLDNEHDQAAFYYWLEYSGTRDDPKGWEHGLQKVEDEVRVHEGDDKSYVEDYIDQSGGVGQAFSKEVIERYFDYEQFGRDIGMDMSEDDEGDAHYLAMSDQERGEAYVDDVGFESLGDTAENYFDVAAVARDMGYNGELHEFDFAGTTYTTDYQG